MSSMGSPKNLPAPWFSSDSRPRWMAPIEAAEMLPYSVWNCAALSPTCCSIARRSFASRSSRPLSSAILNTRFSTPSWVSFSASIEDSSSGPMSEIVARTGWPLSPNTSQNTTGQASYFTSTPSDLARSATFGFAPPALATPERSPLTSAMNTGTPMDEKACARVCRVTVLPVPVAPVIRPWRLARPGSRASSISPALAMSRGWAIEVKLYVQFPERPMAGHSKWANIQHRKGRQDAKRGKVFTRLIKEITVAARLGGGDAGSNPRLRLALDKAREANLPKDTTQNAIGRGTGTLEGVNYEEIRYEGYGIGGAAIIVDCMTDNRTRTVAEVRHAFAKNGGNLGTDGSVAFLFKHCGQFLFAPGLSEDKVMEVALDGGAEDVIANEDGSIEVICLPSDFAQVDAALKKAGLKPEIAEIAMKPTLENALAGDDAVKMRKLLDALEGLDDVQEVYTTAALDEA